LAFDHWPLAFGSWLLAFGFWLLAFGFWLLAFGLWPLAFGFWLLALEGLWLLAFGLWPFWHKFRNSQPSPTDDAKALFDSTVATKSPTNKVQQMSHDDLMLAPSTQLTF
jgi:thiol:disulfide interchange protein